MYNKSYIQKYMLIKYIEIEHKNIFPQPQWEIKYIYIYNIEHETTMMLMMITYVFLKVK